MQNDDDDDDDDLMTIMTGPHDFLESWNFPSYGILTNQTFILLCHELDFSINDFGWDVEIKNWLPSKLST